MSKAALARSLGVSRSSLYYVSRQEEKDWALKARMEELLREQPTYGSRPFALAFKISRERAQRVMQKFGIKPYRRIGRKLKRRKFRSSTPTCFSASFPSVRTTSGPPTSRS